MTQIAKTPDGVNYSPETFTPLTTQDVLRQLRYMKDSTSEVENVADNEVAYVTQESIAAIFEALQANEIIDAGDLISPTENQLEVMADSWRANKYVRERDYCIAFRMLDENGDLCVAPSIMLSRVTPKCTYISIIAPVIFDDAYGLGLETCFKAYACGPKAVEFEAMKINENPPEIPYLVNLLICLMAALYNEPKNSDVGAKH